MPTHNEICNYINTTNLLNYNKKMYDFLKYLNPHLNIHSSVCCQVLNDNQSKPNLHITLDGCDYYISVLFGSGNSVHEENPNDFLNLITSLGADLSVINFIHELCYCHHHTTAFMKTQSHMIIQHVRSFFDTVKLPIIERAMKFGQYNQPQTQYIYWGNTVDSKYCTIDQAIHILNSSISSTTLILIGGLALQRKNYKVNNNIQLKWLYPGSDI